MSYARSETPLTKQVLLDGRGLVDITAEINTKGWLRHQPADSTDPVVYARPVVVESTDDGSEIWVLLPLAQWPDEAAQQRLDEIRARVQELRIATDQREAMEANGFDAWGVDADHTAELRRLAAETRELQKRGGSPDEPSPGDG